VLKTCLVLKFLVGDAEETLVGIPSFLPLLKFIYYFEIIISSFFLVKLNLVAR